MRARRLLLATAALTTAIGCGGSKKKERIYANPKGTQYDAGLVDGGTDAAVDAPPPDSTSDDNHPK